MRVIFTKFRRFLLVIKITFFGVNFSCNAQEDTQNQEFQHNFRDRFYFLLLFLILIRELIYFHGQFRGKNIYVIIFYFSLIYL